MEYKRAVLIGENYKECFIKFYKTEMPSVDWRSEKEAKASAKIIDEWNASYAKYPIHKSQIELLGEIVQHAFNEWFFTNPHEVKNKSPMDLLKEGIELNPECIEIKKDGEELYAFIFDENSQDELWKNILTLLGKEPEWINLSEVINTLKQKFKITRINGD